MAWSDYKICDLCGDAKVFYDANILDERYCATWGEAELAEIKKERPNDLS